MTGRNHDSFLDFASTSDIVENGFISICFYFVPPVSGALIAAMELIPRTPYDDYDCIFTFSKLCLCPCWSRNGVVGIGDANRHSTAQHAEVRPRPCFLPCRH